MDVNNFIDIVFDLKNNSFAGADCIGLVDLYYKCHGWNSELMNYYPESIQWNTSDFRHLIKYLSSNFKRTNDVNALSVGDIIVFKIDITRHIGIIMDNKGLLTQGLPACQFLSSSIIYSFCDWTKWEWIGFRRNVTSCCTPYYISEKDKRQIALNHQPKPVRKAVWQKMMLCGVNLDYDGKRLLQELGKNKSEVLDGMEKIRTVYTSMLLGGL